MHKLGTSVTSEGRVYFTGGVSAVLLGWRDMTLDVDLKDPERLLALYLEIENQMMRYPAVDAEALHERVQAVAREGKWI